MEVLFVSHKYPPSVGGMQKQSYELIAGMEQYAIVHKIVFDGSSSIVAFFLSLKKSIMHALVQHPGISVIHFNDALIASVCINHKGYEHIKRVVTVHGLDVTFPSSIYRKRILPKFNRFDLIIAVSRATAAVCIERGLPAEKVVVINNGVDVSIADIPRQQDFRLAFEKKYGISLQGKKLMVSLGRPVKRKGFSWFIKEVIPRLKGDFVYLMVGPVNLEPSLFQTFLNLMPAKLRGQVELFLGYSSDTPAIKTILANGAYQNKLAHLGKLPFSDVMQLLKIADAFVMPNIHVPGDMEGFGLVCLEACMCGTLVLAANIDGIPDAIRHRQNGWLLPAGNAAAWVDTINNLIDGNPPVNHKQLKDFAAFTVANFKWQGMAKAYYDALKALV